MTICFFEDEGDRRFAPLTLTRPVDDLRVGIYTIREKWQGYLTPDFITRTRRPPLIYLFTSGLPDNDDDVLWINARWLPDFSSATEVRQLEPHQALRHQDRIVAIRLPMSESRDCYDNGIGAVLGKLSAQDGTLNSRSGKNHEKNNIQHEKHRHFHNHPDNVGIRETTSGTLISNLWDLFQVNETEICNDIDLLKSMKSYASPDWSHAILIQADDIYAGPDARVDPGAVIDASAGPVYLGRNSHVMYGAVIQGPGALCDNSVLKMGCKVYPGTTIGPVCKVSGEIHNVIMHSHSNKAHDGYLGNSLIGEWCNLGANTTTSNLKNNYKPVKIPEWATGHVYSTPLQFFGTVMGDHGKTAINTTLSAGTLCGVFCNIFTYGFPPKHIPSFSWVSPEATESYEFEKAMETAEIMMARRGFPLKENYIRMMRHIRDHRQMGISGDEQGNVHPAGSQTSLATK